jgi:5-methylcytosine-specific restriction endonuclease McrBC GTP-binding regulatory subunit McrB
MEENYNRFKSLLEYFVAHLEYMQSRKDKNSRGYEQYIKKYINPNTGKLDTTKFKCSGQGYDGDKIQEQINNWCNYENDTISITINGATTTRYANTGCYLHKNKTWHAIRAKWKDKNTIINSLYITIDEQKTEMLNYSLDDLGLFDAEQANQNLKEFFKKYMEMIDDNKNDDLLNNCISLLESNHNLILTGAPGTGKTYLAKEIAKKMNAEYTMVQFHPSYDYTDFVEGLRPIKDGNNIVFERINGTFKAFCEDALKNIKESKKTNEDIKFESKFKTAYKKFYTDIIEKENIKIKSKEGLEYSVINWNEYDIRLMKTPKSNPLLMRYNNLIKLIPYINKDNIQNTTTTQIKEIIGDYYLTAYWAVLNHIYNNYWNIEEEDVKKIEKKNYVFIIDEINRGEISKIFGELFFAIDPGYRGEKGKIKTQYNKLLEKTGDIFEDGFFVPENVYIIGTMNDIDRSVESIDFAMRRRFAWKEIKADERKEILDGLKEKEKALERLKKLNAEIEKIEGLNSSYHIGLAYFKKLKNYEDKENKWELLWKYHIEGLLYEYLRGYEKNEIKEYLNRLRKAYNGEE